MTFDYRGYFLRLFVLILLGFSLFTFLSDSNNPSPGSISSENISEKDGSLQLLWNDVDNLDFRIATLAISLILVISIISTLYIHFSEGEEKHE